MGKHKYIQIEKGDTIILSSRFIPGNENVINNMINLLFKRGADVIYEKISDVHVSGHASQEDLKLMLFLTSPAYFIPIHGEYRHLVLHAHLARRLGIPQSRVIVAEDGDVIEMNDQWVRISGKVESGRIFVDGKGVGDIGFSVLRDRQHLSVDGMVVVMLVMNKQTGEMISGPDIFSKGFVFEEESKQLLNEAKYKLLTHMENIRSEPNMDDVDIKGEIRRVLKSFFYRETGRRPMIIPIVVEM
jgi:ribonuclease J